MRGDSRLIVVRLHVAGARRPLRALLDSGATNNFVGAGCLRDLPSGLRVREGPGELAVKLADGKPRHMPRRSVMLSYEFDGFSSLDEFLVIDLGLSFDCILGMPWLIRYQPDIDWLTRSVRRRRGFDVGAVVAHLQSAPRNWPHVAVVDSQSTTQTPHRVSDGPLCEVCAPATCAAYATERVPSRHTSAVEQGLPRRQHAIEQGLSRHGDAGWGQHHGEALRRQGPNSSGSSGSWASYDASSAASSDSRLGRRRKWRKQQKRRGAAASLPSHAGTSPVTRVEVLQYLADETSRAYSVELESPPKEAGSLIALPRMSWKAFLYDLRHDELEQVCLLATADAAVEPRPKAAEPKSAREERFAAQSLDALHASGNPAVKLIAEFADVFPDKIPACPPPDRGVRHEIDLVPGSKYCVTRQWPLPRDQVKAIDDFFEGRRAAGHVRESTSPHSSPTFCVKKATGGWRIVHAYNKLNDATIPAQTPIPRKDMVLDTMSGSTIFSAIDLTDGFYQILMRESDVPLTAVSTPSGMLWEWLVMPQGLKNAPATFNRMVSQVLRPLRDFAPSYFDDIFVHSRATDGATDVVVHLRHLRRVFETMREHKLYANLKKCIFCAPEIPVLGCYVGRDGVRADPEKIASVCEWPTPKSQTELRQWLGLANYLHRYTRNYAELIQPLSSLLKKDAAWVWRPEHQGAFESVKRSLESAPILVLPDESKPFHVVCDASDFAIGCALMQFDDDGRERVVSYQSRQLKPPERNYPVHDKELLAMRYALTKFRVHLLGESTFALYTDHASLRTATKSPHLSQRMARWLSFFAEYNFVVHYKPGKSNILADALSRRPDYDPRDSRDRRTVADVDDDDDECLACATAGICAIRSLPVLPLRQQIADAYAEDPALSALVGHLRSPSDEALALVPSPLRHHLARYSLDGDLVVYQVDVFDSPRVVVPNDPDLRARIVHEYHDAPTGGHLGREKTFAALSRDFYWTHMYKWVRKWVRSCEICQRVKPSPSSQAPLRPLPIAADAWRSVSMDFVFGLPRDARGRTGVVVFVDRFSKMVHLAPVSMSITAEQTAAIFLDVVFRLHGLPESIVSDRDPRFTSAFWTRLFELLGSRLLMSTAAHPETDGQTERVNRVLEDVLRSYATSNESWSEFLPLAEFALNNAVHASSGLTPFFVNHARHPRVPAMLAVGALTAPVVSTLDGEESDDDGPAALAGSTRTSGDRLEQSTANDHGKDFVNTATVSRSGATPLALWTSQTLIDPTPVAVRGGAALPVAPLIANFAPKESVGEGDSRAVAEFVLQRQAIVRFVRDSLQTAVDRQKENADQRGRKNAAAFRPGDRVLLSTEGIQPSAVTNLGANKLAPRFIGPFMVLKALGDAYTLELPPTVRLHPTFYVGRLKLYHPATIPGRETEPAAQPARTATTPAGVDDDAPLPGPVGSPSALRRSGRARAGEAARDGRQAPEAHPRADESAQRSASPSSRPPRLPPPTTAPSGRPGAQVPTGSREYRRDGPPPLVDAAGATRWIVECLVDHEDPRRVSRRGVPAARQYRVRWLGYPPEDDTWEPRVQLLRDIPGLVEQYESSLRHDGRSEAAAATTPATTAPSGRPAGHVATSESGRPYCDDLRVPTRADVQDAPRRATMLEPAHTAPLAATSGDGHPTDRVPLAAAQADTPLASTTAARGATHLLAPTVDSQATMNASVEEAPSRDGAYLGGHGRHD